MPRPPVSDNVDRSRRPVISSSSPSWPSSSQGPSSWLSSSLPSA